MPLSEHEQRVLEQIERSLYAEDPKFAATVRGIDPRAHYRRRIVRAVLLAIVGIALLPVGIAIRLIALTFAGFLIMLLAVLYAISAWRHMHDRPDSATATAPAPAALTRRWMRSGRPAVARTPRQPRNAAMPRAAKSGLMRRFEDRWNRRRDGLGR